MTQLFHAGQQLTKVRGVMLFSLVCATASLWAGIHLAQTYGSNPADGGELAPVVIRLAWGIGVASLGFIFAAGMWLYGRCYVAKMELDEQRGELHIYTVAFFGSAKRVFPVSDIRGSRYHGGKLYLAPLVNAPWRSVRLAGGRLPLVLDERGTFLKKEELIDKLL